MAWAEHINPTQPKQSNTSIQANPVESNPIEIQCNQPKPVQSQPINLIQSKQTNAMKPNPMNPMMPSKHSQGNRTNPSSQHNQSYQSKPPVQTSTAMTSIISNQSSQPIKINQIKHADNNPCSKTKHMGLDWMWLITLGCLGFSWMGIACTASLIVWFWAGLSFFLDLIRFGYIILCWICFEWLLFDSLGCLISCA